LLATISSSYVGLCSEVPLDVPRTVLFASFHHHVVVAVTCSTSFYQQVWDVVTRRI